MKTYKYTSDMIKAAIEAGFTHVGGKGFACKGCKSKDTLRKFTSKGRVIRKCKCGYSC